MNSTEMNPLHVVLYEGDGSEPLDSAIRLSLLTSLLGAGYGVTSVKGDGRVADAGENPIIVLGSFKTAPFAEAEGEGSLPVVCVDVAGLSVEQVIEQVHMRGDDLKTRRPGGWKPWFPVIDFDRCTNCMQCLSFCLFDVYGVGSDGKIEVRNNEKCKTDCPACSRVCPEVAILFPKYRQGPINGAEIREQDLNREKVKVDISSLLGGDIYKVLRDRSEHSKSRFARERDDERALKERKRCLKKLKKEFDIPDELLMSLPSLEDIQQKAQAVVDKSSPAGAPPASESPQKG